MCVYIRVCVCMYVYTYSSKSFSGYLHLLAVFMSNGCRLMSAAVSDLGYKLKKGENPQSSPSYALSTAVFKTACDPCL